MQSPQKILDAIDATGWGTSMRVGGYQHVILGFITDGLGVAESITIKVAHSYQEAAPDFTSAAALGNEWAYVQTYNLVGGGGINGNDGITITGADDVVYLEINQNVANWINVQVVTIDGGEATVTLNLPEKT